VAEAGWCGNRACLRCVESLAAVGLEPSGGKKKAPKSSFMSSLRKFILTDRAEVKEKDWPREYAVDSGAPARSKAQGDDACHRDELQVLSISALARVSIRVSLALWLTPSTAGVAG